MTVGNVSTSPLEIVRTSTPRYLLEPGKYQFKGKYSTDRTKNARDKSYRPTSRTLEVLTVSEDGTSVDVKYRGQKHTMEFFRGQHGFYGVSEETYQAYKQLEDGTSLNLFLTVLNGPAHLFVELSDEDGSLDCFETGGSNRPVVAKDGFPGMEFYTPAVAIAGTLCNELDNALSRTKEADWQSIEVPWQHLEPEFDAKLDAKSKAASVTGVRVQLGTKSFARFGQERLITALKAMGQSTPPSEALELLSDCKTLLKENISEGHPLVALYPEIDSDSNVPTLTAVVGPRRFSAKEAHAAVKFINAEFADYQKRSQAGDISHAFVSAEPVRSTALGHKIVVTYKSAARVHGDGRLRGFARFGLYKADLGTMDLDIQIQNDD